LFFIAQSHELWVSDGTEAGTKFLKDLLPGGGAARVRGLFDLDGQLLVLADEGRQLWTSDGTSEGTMLLKQFETGRAEIAKPAFLNGELHFFVALAFNSYEHWKTDGTSAGTQFIQPISTLGGLSDNIKEIVSDGARLYFSARNSDSAITLWTSDGTAAGTHRVADSQSSAVDPKNMTMLGSQLYFTATNPTTGYELWRSDGTSAGTALVGDLMPGTQSSFPGQFTVVGDSLYFTTRGLFQSRNLWRVDATRVQQVEFVEPFQQLSWMYALTAVRGAVFFVGQREGIGAELWRADASGIEIVPGELPGPASAILSTSASSFISVGDHFYYAANDLQVGMELRRLTVGDGDTNFDGEVNLEDLNNVRNHFGKSGGALGDANGDGSVDLADLNAVRNHFGSSGVAAPTNLVQRAHAKATDAVFHVHREELPLGKKAAKRALR
jgi:ELWxxDGT repeat protein